MWGCDFMPIKSDVYPLKTYPEFLKKTQREKKKEWLIPYLLF